MALRTRLFGRLLKISEKGIEDVVDLPAHRAKRAKLQRSAVGGLIFGRPDPAATVDELVIGTVANFRVQKDYPTLLAACRLLVERGAQFRLVAVGQGPLVGGDDDLASGDPHGAAHDGGVG